MRTGAFSRLSARAIERAAVLAALLLSLLSPIPAPAQSAAPVPGAAPAAAPRGVKVIEIKGGIGAGLVQTLRTALEDVEIDRLPAAAVLLLDSGGGDGLAAIEVGRLARAARAHVFVRGSCRSACVFILAGGVLRGSPAEHSVGIHRPRLTTFVRDVGVVDVNPASNPTAARALELANRRSRDYLREMGLPDALFGAMLAVPSEIMKFLSVTELAEYGLLGFDAAYLAAHGPVAAKRYGISEDEFVRRTLQVHDRCVSDYASAQQFVRCYARVLQAGE